MKKNVSTHSTLNDLLARMERLFLSVIIGLIPILVLGLTGWWASIPFVQEDQILFFALGGVLVGILIDLFFVRRITRSALSAPIMWARIVFLFYSICVFGFFMAVPVFNLLLGPLWGYYEGMRLRASNAEKPKIHDAARQSGIFAAVTLAIVCAAALIIAFLDPSLEANIQGMFNLSQPIGKTTILALSSIAGVILVLLEYLITRKTVKFAAFI